jgi:D-lactate dehydrogenase
MPAMTDAFISQLETIAGHRFVVTGEDKTRRFATGFRYGGGRVLAVVRPGTLVEQWRVLQACAAAGKIVIMQAANTGLTGGSTPDGEGYDRDIVIVNTLRLSKIRLIREGKQAVCFPGATLDRLERKLKPLGREPHSVIGSSCIGASVTGGIANNSGGALIRRGPAYTQLALYARMHDDGHIELINHLGIDLGGEAEEILRRLDHGKFTEKDIHDGTGAASDNEYAQHVRMIDADTPARFNADPRRLYEASGCAGKLVLFAVRLDTFEAEPEHKLFYIGANDLRVLSDIRRHVLGEFKNMPVLGEYIHRDAFDVAEQYGKDTFLIINWLGTRFLAPLFALKGRFDGWFGKGFSDRLLQKLSRLFPPHLPQRMTDYRDKFEHHLLLEMSGEGVAEAAAYLSSFFTFGVKGAFFECTDDEKKKALLHRFAVAGAGVRYRSIHADTVEDIVAFDIALRRNDRDWFETLPADISSKLVKALYCGHFLCHVFHQDYIIKKGEDCKAVKQGVMALLEQRGAKYPAEHNVGHFYKAPANLEGFYRSLDPSNALNPGVGQTSKKKHWA